MILTKKIIGKHVNLRSVMEADAEFIIEIRSHSKENTFIHKISTDIEMQKKWIRHQQELDYYFIIERKPDNKPIGTIGAYNFDEANNKTEWGRWICNGNPLESFESAYLLCNFVFNTLNFNGVFGIVNILNKKSINFQKKFGCTIDDAIIKINGYELHPSHLSKSTFETKTPLYQSMINFISC